MGTEDVKVTAMNMYKYKEKLRLYKRWPCSTYILNRVNCRDFNIFSSHGLLLSDLVAQSVERRRSNPKVVGSISIQIVEISRNWSVFKQNMINCTITLPKGLSFAIGQPGMKWVKGTTNTS